jgi:putative ATP-binding cassette transporter
MKLIAFLLRSSKDVRSARGTIAVVVLTGVIGGLCNTALLAVINTALGQEGAPFGPLFWAFLALCVVRPLSSIISQVLLIRFTTRSLSDLRMQMCRRILTVPLRQLEEIGPHRLMATLTDDIPSVINALSNVPMLCINVAVVLGCLAYLGWLAPPVLVAVTVFLLLSALSYQRLTKLATRHFRRAREEWDELYKQFRSMIEGTKELKLHRRRREELLTNNLEASSIAVGESRIRGNTIYISAGNWGQILTFVLIGLIIFVLPSVLAVNRMTLTGYTLAILYMLGPLQVILGTLPMLTQANVAVDKIEALGLSLSNLSSETDSKGRGEVGPFRDRLELVGVTHTYHRERENSSFTLGPIDLSIRPGELLFITGGNGSGKTTLVKLLTGLYIPEGGRIMLAGEPITDENRDFYRQHFSVVFSDFYLFESLLGLAAPETDEKAREYLSLLQLEHKVTVKEGALSTVELSQGQRKRLALLTAYLEDRPIYVFDEWAADQDPLFKEIFYLQLMPELKARGKTVIVISHDDRYYYVADRLVKLDYGKIVSDTPVAAPRYAPADLPLPSAK